MDALAVFFYSMPFLMALGSAFVIAAFGGAVLARPIVPLIIYLAVFFIYPTSSYGSLQASGPSVYFRGSGQLFFPALLWGLLVTVIWIWLGRAFWRTQSQVAKHVPAIIAWFFGWFILLLMHGVVGLFLGQDLTAIFGMHGFVNLPWMGVLVLLLYWSGTSETVLLVAGRLLVFAALTKSIFGLTRYALFGGDSSNVYQNLMGVNVKLTFFDIGDGLVCLLGCVVSVSLLVIRRENIKSRLWDITYFITIILSLTCVTLSFRRTAWVGMVLVSVFLLSKMQPKMRWSIATIGLPILAIGVTYAAVKRIGQTRGASGFSAFFYDLASKPAGPESHRLLELRLAWDAFSSSPLLGIGSWGRYASANLIPWQDPASAGSFLHSGVLHVAMKAGLPGMVLLGGVIVSFVIFVRHMPRDLPAMGQAVVLAGCSGLLFMLPDMLLGTPIPQLRTTQLLALCLGLPYFAAAALSKPIKSLTNAPTSVAWHRPVVVSKPL